MAPARMSGRALTRGAPCATEPAATRETRNPGPPGRRLKRAPAGLRAILAATALDLALSLPALAFPPYRSTDAGTADPWTFEARLGLLRYKRDGGEDAYSSPLLRLNFGLPRHFEVIAELEYSATEGGVADAALGFKWVPLLKSFSLGAEGLLLLPVAGEGGWGVEATLAGTYRHEASGLRVHLNLAGFQDERPAPAERGWKAGLIAEVRRGSFRPGVELFAKGVGSEPTQVLFGPGMIVSVARSDVRLGFHFGLTRAAADAVADLWVATALRVR